VASSPQDFQRVLAPLRDGLTRTAVLLDVDGTLAPIVARPEDSRLLDGVPEVLTAIAGRAALLAFISGRGLADLERLVGLPGAGYAGNHGMELRPPGGAATLATAAVPHMPRVEAFAARWGPERLAPHGVRLEGKGATLSFHWREAPDQEAAAAFLRDVVAADARADGLVATAGRLVLEVRPPTEVDKGTAARALLATAAVAQAVYIGDDRTDADAWRALRELEAEGALERGVCVAVESAEVPPEVRAGVDLVVDGPAGALRALRHIAGLAPG
jgi:trehalose 6-phosphate phosphatase